MKIEARLFSDADIHAYQGSDRLMRELETTARDRDPVFTSHRWLLESLPKRMIFQVIYGDLLEGASGTSILDIGGGYTSLTRKLLEHHDYTLLDIMAHCPHEELRRVERETGKTFWTAADWFSYVPTRTYDYVIANDLFPNVDQRLELFLAKFLPLGRELRMSLTFYNTPRWYAVKRLDGDEVFHMLAWNGSRTLDALRQSLGWEIADRSFETERRSIFPNGRQVAYLRVVADSR